MAGIRHSETAPSAVKCTLLFVFELGPAGITNALPEIGAGLFRQLRIRLANLISLRKTTETTRVKLRA